MLDVVISPVVVVLDGARGRVPSKQKVREAFSGGDVARRQQLPLLRIRLSGHDRHREWLKGAIWWAPL